MTTAARVTVDVLAGVVVVTDAVTGHREIVDRMDTKRMVLNLMDSPEAEQADDEEWLPFSLDTSIPVPPGSQFWVNNIYTVMKTKDGLTTHLSIHANDRHWRHDWRHLQRIKNELCGPEFEAVELYPAESRLVDEANQFHLWVAPEGERIPVGYEGRAVREEGSGWSDGSAQRPMKGDDA